MDPTLAEIRLFAGNYAPRGWAFCNGQLISISQNSALFSLLGTFYGGDGQNTFALPDLRSRVPVGTGQGPGLGNISLGEMGGTPTNTLITPNLPPHNHFINASADGPTQNTASGASLASNTRSTTPPMPNIYASGGSGALSSVMTQSIGPTGSNTPINNLQPYGSVNYIIATEGIYPSRN